MPGAPDATPRRAPTIFVLAGCNGAGKSSIGGAALRRAGADWFEPECGGTEDRGRQQEPISATDAGEVNAAAWNEGRRLLERAIDEKLDFAFETTLGGRTIAELLDRAAANGIAINVWFVGLESVDLHLDRVRRRAAKGGHDIPEAKVRERFRRSRENLIRLLPRIARIAPVRQLGGGRSRPRHCAGAGLAARLPARPHRRADRPAHAADDDTGLGQADRGGRAEAASAAVKKGGSVCAILRCDRRTNGRSRIC